MDEIQLHIFARMADYIATHPYHKHCVYRTRSPGPRIAQIVRDACPGGHRLNHTAGLLAINPDMMDVIQADSVSI